MMVAKRLPNEREAQAGARAAAANAAGLLSDADLLAGVGRYGSALSLAVLAFEESVKVRTLGAIIAAASRGRAPGFLRMSYGRSSTATTRPAIRPGLSSTSRLRTRTCTAGAC
jgi:AbiV